jgi:hypothetical protein
MGGRSSNPASFWGGVAITPSDTVDIPGGQIRGFYVGVAGNVAVVGPDGSVVTYPSLAVGVAHPIQAVRINATNTTATGIIGGR